MSVLKNIGPQDLKDEKLTRLNWNFDYLAGALVGASLSGISAAASGQIATTDTPITSTSPALTAPSSGSLWLVILWPDGSGAPGTLWGAGISATSNFDTTNNTFTVFILAYSPSKKRWVQAAPQVTGASI